MTAEMGTSGIYSHVIFSFSLGRQTRSARQTAAIRLSNQVSLSIHLPPPSRSM